MRSVCGLWCLTSLSTIYQLYRGSVFLVEETGVAVFFWWRKQECPEKVASQWRTLSNNVVSSTPIMNRVLLTTLVVIGTDCTGSCCKSNYHMITTTTAPILDGNFMSTFNTYYTFKSILENNVGLGFLTSNHRWGIYIYL
jgi:hypothetical protein